MLAYRPSSLPYLFLMIFVLTSLSGCITTSNDDDGELGLASTKDILEYQNAPAGIYYDIDGNPASFYDGVDESYHGPLDDFTAMERKMKSRNESMFDKTEEEIAIERLKRSVSPGVKPRPKKSTPTIDAEDDFDPEVEDVQVITDEDANWNGLN